MAVTGTHFSTPGVAGRDAGDSLARANGARVILDIDYRPVLWGVADHARGDLRFVGSAEVTRHLQAILPQCDPSWAPRKRCASPAETPTSFPH